MFQPGVAAHNSGGGDFLDELFGWPGDAGSRPALTKLKVTPANLQRELPRLVSQSFFNQPSDLKTRKARFTRAVDISVALGGILFFAPLMIMIAVAIVASTRGPILFRQQRLGQGGRRFHCLKFRTMRPDADRVLADLLAADSAANDEWIQTHKLRRDPRVSPIGNFLRKTSLDELPQFFNVLAGQMSVVGPRPIVVEEAHRYRRYISAYYAVKPGITGLWQVSGRNHTSYRRRVACDVQYVRTKSALRDLAIIASTVPAVILARGAY